jgi:hypothetical protein
MFITVSKRSGAMAAALAAIILLTASLAAAQDATGQEPAKKYEKYLGKYEFDLSAMGGGMRVFEFYIKDGAFWVEYGFTSPGELKPTEGVADEFSFIEPDDGLTKFTFQKDAEGQYAKVRLVVASLNLDIVGTKQK